MQFNNHSNLKGLHALLGASNYHWLNYDDEKLFKRYLSSYSTTIGTALHELAEEHISQGLRLTKTDKKHVLFWLRYKGIPSNVININKIFPNLMNYVNDAIGYSMTPEVILFYSDNCFGTTDAIKFDNNFLRIHDYKSGDVPSHIEQLEIYAALFCLEYGYKPKDISIELRIYQNDDVVGHVPEPEEIESVINKIISFNNKVEALKEGK